QNRKTKSQAFEAPNPKILQSQIRQFDNKRIPINRLAIVHGRLCNDHIALSSLATEGEPA
ncbi:MAG: hypothetical protein WCE20_12575, partial [Rhizomicrobium sp.]